MSHLLSKARSTPTPAESWGTVGNTTLPVTSRPITQHGVEGMPAPPSSHFQRRVYFDKRYYMTTIQSHMNSIRDEIINLKTNTAKQKPTSATLHNDRRAAKDEAANYAQYQQQLSVLNIALEMHLSRISPEQAIAETAAANKNNATVVDELERMFIQKTTREEIRTKLEKDIENENQKTQMIIEKLPPEQAQEYMLFSEDNKKLLDKIEKMQEEIRNIKESIGQFQEKLVYNNPKQTRLKLIKQLESSNVHKSTLQNHLQEVPVEKEREALLKQVKDDKTDAEALQKVKNTLEEQLREKGEHLSGLEQELDSKNSVRLKKYRDVHVRHAQVNNYIDMFDQMTANLKTSMAEKQKNVAKCLDFLLEKAVDDNFEEVDNLQSELTSGSLADEFKLLNSRLTRLVDTAERFEQDSKALKQKYETMHIDMKMFKDIEGKKQELSDKIREVEEKQKSQKSVMAVTVSAVNDAKKRLEQFETTLERNDLYREFVVLGKQLEQMEVENEKVEEEIKQRTTSEEATKLLEEIGEMTKTTNEILISVLKNNNTN